MTTDEHKLQAGIIRANRTHYAMLAATLSDTFRDDPEPSEEARRVVGALDMLAQALDRRLVEDHPEAAGLSPYLAGGMP